MRKLKNVFAAAIAVVGISAVGVTAFAGATSQMTVNGVPINCKHERTIVDPNPFTGDTVKATATASSAMDRIQTSATVYYAFGNSQRSKSSGIITEVNATKCTASVNAGGLTAGDGAAGWYYASHNGHYDETTTKTGYTG